MRSVTRFTNCLLVNDDGTLTKNDLYVDNDKGKIISGQDYFYTSKKLPKTVIDLQGNILSPGLIDVQINGAYGFDFSLWPPIGTENLSKDEQRKAYLKGLDYVANKIVETGTTSFVPTIITQHKNLYREIIPLLGPRSCENSAHILGYHAEGPFITHSRKGAHAPPYLLNATEGLKSIKSVYDGDSTKIENPNSGVKIITLAPDVEGVSESIKELSKLPDVTISIGHSDASVELATKAINDGSRFITHLFNAMPQLHHRDPGVIGLLGGKDTNVEDKLDRPFYGLIVDGVHVHPNAVRLAYDAHPNGCVLVTDAMPMMDPNLEDGIHCWRDGRNLEKIGPKLYLQNTKTLAGSASSLDQCVRNMKDFTSSLTYANALNCASNHPAQLLKLKSKGNLNLDSDADLVLIDRTTGHVKGTWILGKQVYKSIN